ncbi:LPS translocon maturation chaperone LptM [Thiolapillus brandeum]|nr:lipoprotein [Thiolapillus brandeum]
MMKRLLLLLVLVLPLLSACGSKGPLYLPDDHTAGG